MARRRELTETYAERAVRNVRDARVAGREDAKGGIIRFLESLCGAGISVDVALTKLRDELDKEGW